MNLTRKRKLSDTIDKLESLKEEIELIKEDEEDFIESTPDHLRDTDDFCESESSIDCLNSALATIDELIENLSAI